METAQHRRILWSAIITLSLSVCAILGALWLEFVEGYLPCELCYKGRLPHYLGIPALLLIFIMATKKVRHVFLEICIVAAIIFYICGFIISVYHAGVEWKMWEGPTSCGGVNIISGSNVQSLLENIKSTKMVLCTEPALKVFGLSLAGYNAIICLVIVTILLSLTRAMRQPIQVSRKQQ